MVQFWANLGLLGQKLNVLKFNCRGRIWPFPSILGPISLKYPLKIKEIAQIANADNFEFWILAKIGLENLGQREAVLGKFLKRIRDIFNIATYILSRF